MTAVSGDPTSKAGAFYDGFAPISIITADGHVFQKLS
jgi:hypothetical protein